MRRGNLLAATRCYGRVVAAWVGLKSLFLILALCKRLISTSRKQLPFVAANDNVVGDACDVPSSVTPMTWCRCDVVCDFILCNWCDVSWRDVVRTFTLCNRCDASWRDVVCDVYFMQSMRRVVTFALCMVWPDVEIKAAEFRPKVGQKVSKADFDLKVQFSRGRGLESQHGILYGQFFYWFVV